MPEVYSYYFPETAAVIAELRQHADFDSWFSDAWLGRENSLPEEFLSTWRAWSGLDLRAFAHAYPCNGSAEAIRELVRGETLIVFRGEYEGYAAIAAARGMRVLRIDREDARAQLDGLSPAEDAVFCISEPSALDGEHWSGLDGLLDGLHPRFPRLRVILDLCYVGLVREPHQPRLDWPAVETVIFSLSKPFGLYRWRVGGLFSRKDQPLFAYNRWFNSLFALKAANGLMTRYAAGDLATRYAGQQQSLVDALRSRGAVPNDTVPSNVLLLARSATAHADARYNRAAGHSRYCLTPGLSKEITKGGQ